MSVVKISKIAGLMWLPVPPMVLSALIHMTDPDIDGWHGLGSYSALWLVLVVGVLTAGWVMLCLVVLVEKGWFAFIGTAVVFAAISGLLLAFFASGATTTLGIVWTFVASSLLVFVTALCAVLPAAAVGWLPRSD